MIRQEVVLVNALGLHARAAARFVQMAGAFESRIQVAHRGATADGKSILGLLALLAPFGARLEITTEGSDEAAAARAHVGRVSGRFGDDR